MLVAVAALTIVVGLLSFLVVGLLRSHAEILLRLDSGPSPTSENGSQSQWRPPSERVSTELAPSDVSNAVQTLTVEEIRGEDLDLVSRIVVLPEDRPTVLAFLSTGCLTCGSFFGEFAELKLGELDPPLDLVVVTKSREEENLTRLRNLAPDNVTVVMSSITWEALEVPGSPYFVLVDGQSRQLLGAGTANTWSQVQSLVEDSLGERAYAGTLTGERGASRLKRERDELAAAGIGPEHPSLYVGMFGEEPPG